MKSLGIFLFDEVEVLDFAGPFEVFSVASQLESDELDVFTFSHFGKDIHTVNDLQVSPKYNLRQLEKIDYLVIPGGEGSKAVIQNIDLLNHLDRLIQSSSWTMSVCSGSRVLAALGHLADAPYCTHHSVYASMAELEPSGDPRPDLRFVQSSDRIFTAAGISAGIDLSFDLLEKTFGKDLALKTAQYMEYLPFLQKQ
ncbi:DJ-1/PfpI family protein [Algoriphagus namhaensis]